MHTYLYGQRVRQRFADTTLSASALSWSVTVKNSEMLLYPAAMVRIVAAASTYGRHFEKAPKDATSSNMGKKFNA